MVIAPKETEKSLNWTDAISYCASLNSRGYTDWRLPSANDFNYLWRNRMTTGFDGIYWCADHQEDFKATFQYFCFGYAGIKSTDYRDNYFLVRAVRGSPDNKTKG